MLQHYWADFKKNNSWTLTLQLLHNILKSRPFKSTDARGQSFIFTFDHEHIFRDAENIADYNLEENNGNYFIKLYNVKSSVGTSDFKNVLLVSDDEKELLNYDKTHLQTKGRIDITFVGQ